MGNIFFYLIFLLFILLGAYLLLKYIYGKDYKKWKPQVFTQDVTFKSIFQCKKDKSSKKKH